jgi:hypothetical protein
MGGLVFGFGCGAWLRNDPDILLMFLEDDW